MSIELVVFDWDGTLMDSEEKIVACLVHAFRDVGLPEPSPGDARATIGLSLGETMRALSPRHDAEQGRALLARYRHWFSAAGPAVKLFPTAIPVLKTLESRGLWMAVATGKSSAGLKRDLDGTGLARFFHSTRCADQASSKPHPQMLEEIMDDLDVGANKTVMIGDTGFDMEMARNAGTHAIGVTYGAHSLERLLEFSPYATLDTLGDLPALLGAFD